MVAAVSGSSFLKRRCQFASPLPGFVCGALWQLDNCAPLEAEGCVRGTRGLIVFSHTHSWRRMTLSGSTGKSLKLRRFWDFRRGLIRAIIGSTTSHTAIKRSFCQSKFLNSCFGIYLEIDRYPSRWLAVDTAVVSSTVSRVRDPITTDSSLLRVLVLNIFSVTVTTRRRIRLFL